MDADILTCDVATGVARLMMNRPAKMTALSDAMLAALKAKFSEIAEDSAVRVVILSGAGKAFCAGHDLSEMQTARESPDKGAAYFADLFGRCAAVMQMIPALPQPVIAEVPALQRRQGVNWWRPAIWPWRPRARASG